MKSAPGSSHIEIYEIIRFAFNSLSPSPPFCLSLIDSLMPKSPKSFYIGKRMLHELQTHLLEVVPHKRVELMSGNLLRISNSFETFCKQQEVLSQICCSE